MSFHPVSSVETGGESEVQGVHADREGAFVDVQHQVVMGRHQTEREARPMRPLHGACELTEERRPVDVVAEKRRGCPHRMHVDVKEAGTGI
jgi:hypothetical protein